MAGFWSTLEITAVVSDWSYEQYLQLHKESKDLGAPLGEAAFKKLHEVVGVQMEEDFNREKMG